MTHEKKVRATPIPQGYDRILTGALKLELTDRGKLRDALIESIKTESAELIEKAKAAATIANGTGG